MIDLRGEEDFEGNFEDRGRDLQAEIEAERIAEALVFASSQPVSEGFLAERLPEKTDVHAIMLRLKEQYAPPGRQSCAGRRRLGLPHRRRPVLRHPP
ncbi:hypothetical protein ABIA10_001907 [Rhizobium leguminosarum]